MEKSLVKLFKVPNATTQQTTDIKLHICGVIDASGSMSSVWPILANFWNEAIPKTNCYTITFDTSARVCETNIL